MEAIKSYIISVIAASIVCAICKSFLSSKTTVGVIGNMIAGVFLVVTVINPWAKLKFMDMKDFWDDISVDAAASVQGGEIAARQELHKRIIAQTEAYILDKAADHAAQISVEVTLCDDNPSIPCAVEITGAVSPYAKRQLQQILFEDLGIPKEAQTWTG